MCSVAKVLDFHFPFWSVSLPESFPLLVSGDLIGHVAGRCFCERVKAASSALALAFSFSSFSTLSWSKGSSFDLL